MLSISAFSIDIMLPAFPGLSESLGATSKQIQLLVPVYLLALGLAHPFYGALSDRVGRKPGVYLGLSLFMVGTLVCLLSHSLVSMLCGRFLQGFGAAAGAVVCRAMIRDRFSGSELAQNMAIASMFFAIGPVLAPLIGYVIYAVVGWRGIFVFLMFFAIALAYGTYLQPETLAPVSRRKAGWSETINNFSQVVQLPQSRYFIFVGIFSTCLIVSFLEHAQALYAELGADSKRFAYLFAFSSVGIVFGQLVNHRLIGRYGAIGAARIGAAVVCVTSFIILSCVVGGVLTDRLMTVLMLGFHTSYLVIYSNVVSLAIDPHSQRAGAASAVFGLCGYVVGSLLATLVTVVADERMSRWSVCFFLITFAIVIATYRWRPPAPADA